MSMARRNGLADGPVPQLSSLQSYNSCDVMRITIRVPDDLGEKVKRRTDNVSAYVVDALTDKIEREEREEARREILEMAGSGDPEVDLHAINQRERREGDRTYPEPASVADSSE